MSEREPYVIRRGSFSWALEELKRGEKVKRAGWTFYLSLLELPNTNGIKDLRAISIDIKMLANWNMHVDDLFAADWIIYTEFE